MTILSAAAWDRLLPKASVCYYGIVSNIAHPRSQEIQGIINSPHEATALRSTRKMHDLKRIILFAGQGSPKLFSEQAASTAASIVRSNSLASILLSKCHAALLQELHTLNQDTRQRISLDINSFLSSENVLKPDHRYHNNPVIQSTTICVHQLLEFLSFVQTHGPDTQSTLDAVSETAGFCSGVFPAIVVAASRSSEEYVHYGVAAFRAAFWLGVRSSLYCQKVLQGFTNDLPWSMIVTGLKRHEVQKKLDSFNQVCRALI